MESRNRWGKQREQQLPFYFHQWQFVLAYAKLE